MSRRKGEITGHMNERNFPHVVELALPPGGFRSRSSEFEAFHRELGNPIRRGRGRHGTATSVRGGWKFVAWQSTRLRLERGLQGPAREYVAAFHRGLAVVQDAMTMLEIPSDESGGAPGRLLHARERDGGNTETLK
jgi:hypothetical protein